VLPAQIAAQVKSTWNKPLNHRATENTGEKHLIAFIPVFTRMVSTVGRTTYRNIVLLCVCVVRYFGSITTPIIPVKKRKLGRSDLEVSPLAFGGNVFGWTADEPTSMRLLDRFVDEGFNLIDTADTYSKWVPGNRGGESETLIGKWLKKSGKRAKIIIATKVGVEMAPDKKGLAPAYIQSAVEDSLKRLQTDYIDLYQSHIDDPATPLADTLGAYDKLIKAGKVRVVGASNYSAERFEEALAISKQQNLPRYETLQPNYNLIDRADFEAKLQGVCVKNEVGVINYFSLASGFLTGKYRSEADLGKSPRGERMVKKHLNERGFRILAALDSVAKDTSSTPGRVAIAWLLAQPGITAPIASATSLPQLEDLFAATRLTLDPAHLKQLDAASK
jgi:aryl-alcohol dehydrogenase-like predicted oxidoreductase